MDLSSEYPCKNFLGIRVSGYKSFGPEPQDIFPFSKLNIFAGKNNAGKSNCLSAIQHVLGKLQRNGMSALDRSHFGFDRQLDPRFGVILKSVSPAHPVEFWRNNSNQLLCKWPRCEDGYLVLFEIGGGRNFPQDFLDQISTGDSEAWVRAAGEQWNFGEGEPLRSIALHTINILDELGPVKLMTVTPDRTLSLTVQDGARQELLKKAQQGEFTGDLVTSLIYYLQEPEPEFVPTHGVDTAIQK